MPRPPYHCPAAPRHRATLLVTSVAVAVLLGAAVMEIAGKPLRYWVARSVLDAFGWEVEGRAPDEPKYVLLAAPHTSNWDFVFTLGVGWVLGIEPTLAGKHTLTEGPFGWFFKRMGVVPIDRRKAQDQVQQLVEMFNQRERMVLIIAPEGTRSSAGYWRSGFYWVARGAKVPIALGYLDYARRRGGISEPFHPGDDPEADVERIRAFYSRVTAKHPHLFTNIRFRPAVAR